jgi:hypothetical protein
LASSMLNKDREKRMLVGTRSLSGRTLRILALLVVLASLLAGRDAAASHEEALLTDAPGAQTDGRTDGEWVVWLDRGEKPAGQADIYAARLSDRIAFPVSTEPFDHTPPAIDNGVVVWAEHDDDNAPWTIVARDLATGERLTIASSMNVPNPRISGTRIVWSDRDPESGEPVLLTRDIATDEQPVVLATAFDGAEGIWDVEIAGTTSSGGKATSGITPGRGGFGRSRWPEPFRAHQSRSLKEACIRPASMSAVMLPSTPTTWGCML